MAAPKKPTGQLNTWDEQLAAEAKIASAAEAAGAERVFINFNKGLSVGDVAQADNQMPLILLDAIFVNTYYLKPWDPKAEAEAPSCFAMGRPTPDGKGVIGIDTKDGSDVFGPHKDCTDPQSKDCASCKWNQFGTARQGKGKACGNTRRFAAVAAGTFTDGRFQAFKTGDQIASQPMLFGKLSPTNLKAYPAYTKAVASVLERPPYGVFTTLRWEQDTANQYSIKFEALGKVTDALMPEVMKRREEALATIDYAWTAKSEPVAPAAKAKAAAKKKY